MVSSTLLQSFSLPSVSSTTTQSTKPTSKSQPTSSTLLNRRQSLILLTSSTALTAVDNLTARAQDIPLFGIRKKLVKVEEEAEEILKEGTQAAEKGIEAAEKGVETAEREIESAVSFNGLSQAGVVVGAEVLGVLVATSIVNGILGPERVKT